MDTSIYHVLSLRLVEYVKWHDDETDVNKNNDVSLKSALPLADFTFRNVTSKTV